MTTFGYHLETTGGCQCSGAPHNIRRNHFILCTRYEKHMLRKRIWRGIFYPSPRSMIVGS